MRELKLKTTPYNYQLKCHQEIDDFNGRALVAIEQGLGKTLQSLLYFHSHQDAIRKAVVVCPASIKWVWEQETKKHLGLSSIVLQGRTDYIQTIESKTRLYIVNYDILSNWLQFLLDLEPDLVIGDEIHYLKGLYTQRTISFRLLCEKVPHILALSGTPIINNPSELWPILNVLRPDKWKNPYSFFHRFCGPRMIHGRWRFTGVTNVKQLNRELKQNVMVRRRYKDVMKELPPKTRSIIPLDIDNRSEYEEAMENFLKWLRKKSPSKANRAARNEAKVKIGYMIRLASTGKLSGIIEWINNFLLDGDNKLLVFGIHKKIITRLEKRYKGISVKVTGETIGNKRELAFKQFNTVKKTRLLLGNIQAAGTGWSCTCTSDTAVIEFPWSPGTLDQALSRCHGIGRGIEGDKSRGWLFVARNTIEEKLLEILQKKQRGITSTLDGVRVENEMNVFDQLIQTLEGGWH